jgi:hypothetical protein
MATPLAHMQPPPLPVPVAPTEEEWRAMTPAERERFIISVNIALSDPAIAMSEGRPHKKAKSRALDMLGLHFRTLGRRIYLAEEMAVVYPGQEPFSPDVLAVVDVEEPEDDPRMAWVVADEGKGLDWVLEVLHAGDRKKDLECSTSSATRRSASRNTSCTTGASSEFTRTGWRAPGGTSLCSRRQGGIGRTCSGSIWRSWRGACASSGGRPSCTTLRT